MRFFGKLGVHAPPWYALVCAMESHWYVGSFFLLVHPWLLCCMTPAGIPPPSLANSDHVLCAGHRAFAHGALVRRGRLGVFFFS